MALIETDTNTNINISAATEIGSFTAAENYDDFYIQVFLDQIAGGNYDLWITHQRAGAGSAHKSSVTTYAVSGATTLKAQTQPFGVDNTDVIKVYVDGQAGDTTTPDTIVQFRTLSKPPIKKNTALANFEFLMVDATDNVTPETGLTVTATRSIDGGAFASCTNAVSEVSDGVYKINLSAADLNGNVITLKFAASGAAQTTITLLTQ